MKILGDSQITNATITATNILTSPLTKKLQTFQLTDNMRTIANSTVIDITFPGTIPDIDTIALCGTNLTPTAVINVSYSNTNINSPDDTILLDPFSTLNQIMFLVASLNKKYWRISITDTAVSQIFIGYIYIGVSLNIPYVEFGHNPSLDIFSNSNVTPTGQGYGSKIYNALQVEFTMLLNITQLEAYIEIVQEKQNIDPVIIVEYPLSYDNALYRPKYGVLSSTSVPYQMSHNNLRYAVSARLEERF